jgi:hypothetical protein
VARLTEVRLERTGVPTDLVGHDAAEELGCPAGAEVAVRTGSVQRDENQTFM